MAWCGTRGRKLSAVLAHVCGLTVEGVDCASEPPLAVAVEPEGLPDLYEWEGGARVGEGSPETVGRSVRLHRGAGGLHGFVAGGDGGVEEVVVADDER